MATAITTVLTWALTGLSKNIVIDKWSPNRLLAVRALAAAFALGTSVLGAIVYSKAFDVGLVGIFVDAVIAWLAAIGIFHAPSSAS